MQTNTNKIKQYKTKARKSYAETMASCKRTPCKYVDNGKWGE